MNKKKHWVIGSVVSMMILGLGFVSIRWYETHRTLKPSQQAVILVHGILNKPFFMNGIAKVLREAGYPVYNWGYPSRSQTIEEHAASLHDYLKVAKNAKRIHFVGFSQGAIIIRYMLTHYRVPHKGRFIMIAPPNHGSELAEHYYRYPWFRMLYGDQSIKQIFASQKEFFKEAGIPRMEFGIIAGGKGDGKGYSDKIPGDDDSAISVASARLEGSKDFIILDHRHTPLVFSEDTAEQTLHFIETGKFARKQK